MASDLLQLILAGMEKEEKRYDRELGRSLALLESASNRRHDKMMLDDRQEFEEKMYDRQVEDAEEASFLEHYRSIQKEKDLIDYRRDRPTIQESIAMKQATRESLDLMQNNAIQSMGSIIAPYVNQYNFTDEESFTKQVELFEEAFKDGKLEGSDEYSSHSWINALLTAQKGDPSALTNLMNDLSDRKLAMEKYKKKQEGKELIPEELSLIHI